MAWITKSNRPHSFSIVSKTESTLAMSLTSQGRTSFDPMLSARGITRFLSASP